MAAASKFCLSIAELYVCDRREELFDTSAQAAGVDTIADSCWGW